MIPICLSPGDPSASLDQKGIRLCAFPLSKRWVSLTVSLQSLPVSKEAPNKGLPLSPNQRECRKRNTTHIYEIIWHLMFHHNERKNCFSLAELKHATPGNGLVLLLSCLWEGVYFFWQEGYVMMLFSWTVWNQQGRKARRSTYKNNHGIILLPLFTPILIHTKYILDE